MAKLAKPRLPGAPGLAVRIGTPLSGNGVRVKGPPKSLKLQLMSGYSGVSGYQNYPTVENALPTFRDTPPPLDTRTTTHEPPVSPCGRQKYPDYPDYPDRASSGAGLGCQGKRHQPPGHPEYPDSPTGKTLPPPTRPDLDALLRGDVCRCCGRPIDWRRDGVAFADNTGAHIACYEADVGALAP
jgi:hypothetical protein